MSETKRETMSSRERVMKAVAHEEPDRVPIDLGFHYSTGISAFAYKNLREYLNLEERPVEIIDFSQFLARVEDDVLKRFRCDAALLNPGALKYKNWNPRGNYNFQIDDAIDVRQEPDGSYANVREWKSYMPKNGFFFDQAPSPISYNEDENLIRYAKEAERIYNETDYYTMYIGYHAYFSFDADTMCLMLTDPDEFLEDNEYTHKKQMRSVAKVIESMGRHIQAIALNADLGSQNGPFVRPSLFDDLCAPFIKRFCDYVHEQSDLKVFIHSCGSIRRFMKTLIECGIDIFNPVQVSAAEMDPSELKRDFGDRAAFWGGGCETQGALCLGTPDDVKKNVSKLVNIFKPGGGFVFNQVHNVMGDVKPENIVAMLDTAYENSFY